MPRLNNGADARFLRSRVSRHFHPLAIDAPSGGTRAYKDVDEVVSPAEKGGTCRAVALRLLICIKG
jgi:hypothetical protein